MIKNRNRIVRIQDDRLHKEVTMVSNYLDISYQSAFEVFMHFLLSGVKYDGTMKYAVIRYIKSS